MIEYKELITADEDELIQREFDALLHGYMNSYHRKKSEIIIKAFNFAKAAHKGFRRKSGEPYILHPLAVARIVSTEIGLGSTSICAALLHDVIEDTDYTAEDIANLFGDKIAQIVEGLTKISGGIFAEVASVQAENFRKLILTMSEDVRVVIIKIADRLHNMRTLSSLPPAKQFKIAGETQYIYAPLAHRLGLYRIKNELENLSFKYDHPEMFAEIESKLASNEAERKKFFEELTIPISKELTNQGWTFRYKMRVKTVYSIWKKMNARNIPFHEVYDIMALRIVFTPREHIDEREQCWSILTIISKVYQQNEDRIRDWVKKPKDNGYESLHTTIMGPNGNWVEIQIRSERMNDIAEKGLASHWKYKNGDNEGKELSKWINNIRELLENPEPDAIDFLDTFQLSFYSSEIFVFTPKGEIKTLPKDSSALDFAFTLHSDIGEHCIGAKVNHRLVPLSHPLKSGDQVEIITSRKQTPQPEWRNYVKTARAKTKLNAILNRQNKELITKGQLKLEEFFTTLNLQLENEHIVHLLSVFKLPNRQSLFLEVGNGNIDLSEIKKNLPKKTRKSLFNYLKIRPSEPVIPDTPTPTTEDAPRTIDRKKTFYLTDENNNVTYLLSECCRPIPGDDILGLVNENEVTEVHVRSCPLATRQVSNYGDKVVNTEWAVRKSMLFVHDIEINGIDKKGVLAKIINLISDQLGVNISKINIETNDGMFKGQFSLNVHDRKEIEKLCKKLNSLAEVNLAQPLTTRTLK